MVSLKNCRILCLYLLCIGIVDVELNGDFAVAPRNEAVIAGQRMAMECRASNDSEVFKWTLTRPTSQEKQWIVRMYNGKEKPSPKFPHFGLDLDRQGSGFIFTNSTQSSDAGLYFCYVNPEQHQSSAHLIVFEDEPLCEVNYTGHDNNTTVTRDDLISMRCSANFSGLWTPSVEWRQHAADNSEYGDDGKVLTSGVVTSSSFNMSITSVLIVSVDFHKSTYFSFKIFFLWRDDTIPVNATNLPDFHYEWKSPEVIVALPEMEAAKLPAVLQVVVETVTSEVKSIGEWYLISVVLLIVFVAFVFVVVGSVARRCYIGYRRVNGLDQRSSPANATVLPGLERPPSGDYDVIPLASPNIYERIDDYEAKETVTYSKCQQQPLHLPLTQCYSGLSDVNSTPPDPYDVLTLYLSMESPSKAPVNNPLGQIKGTEKGTSRNLYTSAIESGRRDKGKSDYLTLLGEGEVPVNTSALNASSSEFSDYVQADVLVNRFPKTSDDYLIPFS